MSQAIFLVAGHDRWTGSWWSYRIASQLLLSNVELAACKAFLERGHAAHRPPPAMAEIPQAPGSRLGECTLGDFPGSLRSYARGGAFELVADGVERFTIEPGERQVVVRVGHPLPSAPPSPTMEALLGAMIFVLALRRTFCLHASAVAAGGLTVAFLGDSGAGKSTLAIELSRLREARWRLLADDVLPAVLQAHRPLAEPGFPQLKFKPDEQPAAGLADPVPLGVLYVLTRPSAAEGGVVSERLGPPEALLAVASQTMAARLFDTAMLDAHLGFCQAVAEAVPVRALTYPRRLDVIPEVAGVIARDLAAARKVAP